MSALPLFEKVFDGTPAPTGKPLSGEDLKRSGMKSVYRHTPDWYRDAFRSAVEKFPRGKTFTVEEVRQVIGDPPSDVSPNCMGALMRSAALRGLIKKSGQVVKAQRPSLHSSDLSVWQRI